MQTLVPCTAAGILQLLDEYHVPIAGKQVVIVGRSAIVVMPTQVRRPLNLPVSSRARARSRSLSLSLSVLHLLHVLQRHARSRYNLSL